MIFILYANKQKDEEIENLKAKLAELQNSISKTDAQLLKRLEELQNVNELINQSTIKLALPRQTYGTEINQTQIHFF